MIPSLLDILNHRAQHQSEQLAYIFLQNGETESGSLTYGELNRQAKVVAAHLQFCPGERALLLYPSGLEFITAFFGCLYAGVVAVPVYLPRRNQDFSRLLAIAHDAQARIALSTASVLEELGQSWKEQPDLAQLELISTENLAANSQEFVPKVLTPEDLAFLQYTSGSTGTPKGVMVSHGNIIHNQKSIYQAFGHTEKSIGVGWLPLFHDMGLIGNVLQSIYLGTLSILMPPVAFFQKPIRWLQAISKYRANTSGGPNFAYDLCVNRIQLEELTELDLSSWDLAFNGAEPVRAETLKKFSEKFSTCGFRASAFYPCYGMAETTLLATGGNKHQEPVIQGFLARELERNRGIESEISSKESRVLVGCGRPVGTKTIIVNPESLTRCETAQVGEIWLSGSSIAAGYWNRPEATQETFQAYLRDTGEGPFLRTGDLGFLNNNQELFITGRLKDVILIRGRNHYPQDIELSVEKSHPAIRENSSAAFGIEIGAEESLVIVCEVERTYLRKLNIDEIVKEIKIAVLAEHELDIYGILLLKPGSIPRTSSGKIQRNACKTKFLEGSFSNVVEEWRENRQEIIKSPYVAPRTSSEKIIAIIFSEVLGIETVGIHDNFFSLGGQSLLATQLISRLRIAFSVEIPLRIIFDYPTVAELDQTIAELHKKDNGLTLPPIQAIKGDIEQFPLSWAQERLWFLYQLEGSTATYNVPAVVYINGDLDTNTLQQALSEIVHRHSILRTNFQTVNGVPMQVIHSQVIVNINLVDLKQLLTIEREIVQNQLAAQEVSSPFILETAPLIRCTLLQLSDVEYVLLLTMHHIVSDGWSMGVFISELSALYQAFLVGKPSPLPELLLQYTDFAVWQRQWLTGSVLKTQINYWRDQLHGASSLLQLPTDRPRPVVQTYQGRTHSFTLNKDLTQELQSLSGKSGTTLFMTLLTALATLLYRYSGQSDILIGSPIANRHHKEIEPLIGFFVNTLVLRTNLASNPSFETLLAQVKETALRAYEHQDVPFEQVVEALQPQRSLSHSPLFQVMFVLQDLPLSAVELPGITLTQLNAESTVAKFDLTLSMSGSDQGLVGELEYNTDLFDGLTIERMAGHFQNLLSAVVKNPALSVAEILLLSEAERYQLLVEWNATESEYPTDKCIHQLFEAQVEQTPHAIAVIFGDQHLTYAELNTRANQLAHYLQTLGVKPEVLVGLFVERSIEMVVAMLGILKAGGAYVPLDPEYPQERLNFMLEDTQLSVILTQEKLVNKLGECQASVIRLDSNWDIINQQTQHKPITSVKANNLAYVMYTSGSTGQPKGVSIVHQGVVRLVKENDYASFSAEEVFLQFAPISFDAATFEIWGCLLNGGQLIIFPFNNLSINELAQVINQYQVTTLWLTAALFHLMVDENIDALRNLRQLLAGGDILSVPHVQKFLQTVGNCKLINGYGPTENTTFTCCYSIPTSFSPDVSVPIGRPIANTQVYILDKNLQPVPVGVPGELHIGGTGLARGYFNRPELTQEKFISNPFEDVRESRLYKTGDLARYLPDGNIEYLGRIDNQIKIRGFRIELGEIEATLSQHSDVQASCVTAREDTPGDKRLVAYVVAHQDSTSTINQLRQFLKEKLPDYMMPNAFVILESLPLTPSGKVDRKALPTPDRTINREQEYVAPRTATEEIIANIFATLIAVQNVGIYDNFFSLGGHSLLATQLISRLRVAFSIEIPLRTVFEFPTVAQLDQKISQLRMQGRELSLPKIERIAPNTKEIPLSFAQERLWFLNQIEGASATYNIPVALSLSGELNLDALHQALAEIVRRHEILRTSFANIDGTPTQVIHPTASMDMEIVDLQHLEESERELIVKQQIQQLATNPFDLESAPLIRCSLWHLSDTDYVFSITMHHIVSDGWSIGVLIRELSVLYKAFCAGESSPLAELEIQYADFALWQRQWLSGSVLKEHLQYWISQLRGAPELLQLPTDLPRPSIQSYRGATKSFSLSTELTQKLEALSRQKGSTLFMTLLAAFATFLCRYSSQLDVTIGSPIANRHRSEIEPLVGFFVNTLVLRTQLEDNLSFEQVLAQVRETTLQAYDHQDLPFEQVVEALQPQRSMSHTPLFQVMFIMQNAPMGNLELPGVVLSNLEQDSTVAKFDLTLSVTETSTGLGCVWEYNTDLFYKSTIERMASHFENLLSAIAENPQQNIFELPLLSTIERQQLLFEWNETQTEYPQDKCIHSLFEEQVKRTPEAVAVMFEGQQLTYRELDQRANQLAHYLQTLGVESEVLVGICVERSLDMVVGLLGILKAGGAYVPLDPNYPSERLTYILSNAQVSLLLTHQYLEIPKYDTRIIYLDTDWSKIATCSEFNFSSKNDSESLAYLIYTSGSTGRPKGVQIIHRSVVNFLVSICQSIGLTSQDILFSTTSISFDISVLEIFLPLSLGSCLILVGREVASDGLQLLDYLVKSDATVMQATPATWQLLLNAGWHGNPRLKILCGGEVLSEKLAHQLLDKCGFLWNLYGPTETTIWSSIYKIESKEYPILIGKPISNTQIYVLNSYLQPVPIGVSGELYIGGDGLARGYLNHPELTQEKFILNPFSSNKSARLYKTGDLARYLSDGNIEILGRIDHQIKIRGFRIEPGEIEAVLSRHPQIQQAVVIASPDSYGNKRLIAYLISEGENLSIHQLRDFLQQQLPTYMIPAAFVSLESLPLTPNGKVDRKALPAPNIESARTREYVAPRTPSEKIIANIFCEVLGIENTSIYDNFFELGGDSLLSIQIVARANKVGLSLTPKLLFQHQTVVELAEVVGTNSVIQAEQGLVIGSVPLLPVQHGFFERNLSQPHLFYNRGILLEVRQALDPSLLKIAFQHLLIHHDALRLRFIQEQVGWLQVNESMRESSFFSQVDLSKLLEEEQECTIKAVTEELQTSLNLSEMPLMRVAFFDLGSQKPSRVLIIIHHLVVDNVSHEILFDDLQTAYQQLSRGEIIQLPPKTTSFKHWAERLAQYAQSLEIQQEIAYWSAQSRTHVCRLPVDYPEVNSAGLDRCCVRMLLNAEETQVLLQKIPASTIRTIDILLTALVQIFTSWTGTRSLLVRLVGHGRDPIFEDVDLSRTVGWFATSFPVLLELGEASTLGDALQSVKEQIRRIPNWGIGYGLLRYMSNDTKITEQLRSFPKPEVSFNYFRHQSGQILSESSLFKPVQSIESKYKLQPSTKLRVFGQIRRDCLQLDWIYSEQLYHRSTIENLAQGYVEAIRLLIFHCQSLKT